MSALVAIHQPNFFPWLGFFDKIRRADIFVFLDAVDYPRSGSGGMGSWLNRVRISIQGEARWITCPIRRMPLGSLISAAEIDDAQPWRGKLLKTLAANYRRADRYDETMTWLEPLLLMNESRLAVFNMHAIMVVAEKLGLSTRFVVQSALPHEGSATRRLVSIVQAVGGDGYLAGGGATGYQEDHLFGEAGISLRFQNFAPRSYGPASGWMPGLSVIDYLLHDGRPLAAAFPDEQGQGDSRAEGHHVAG